MKEDEKDKGVYEGGENENEEEVMIGLYSISGDKV